MQLPPTLSPPQRADKWIMERIPLEISWESFKVKRILLVPSSICQESGWLQWIWLAHIHQHWHHNHHHHHPHHRRRRVIKIAPVFPSGISTCCCSGGSQGRWRHINLFLIPNQRQWKQQIFDVLD